jgi:hypothetical protein
MNVLEQKNDHIKAYHPLRSILEVIIFDWYIWLQNTMRFVMNKYALKKIEGSMMMNYTHVMYHNCYDFNCIIDPLIQKRHIFSNKVNSM